MIWYILYPFRGTTDPPRLTKTHPLRRAFQAHGEATARHWSLSIGVTIVVSVLLCYPALFQTDSPAAIGLRNLPEHVWTSTTEVSGDRPADVEVRQVWVHGDYMKALEPRVLAQALRVQEALIGDGFEGTPGAGPGDGTRYPAEEGGCLRSEYGGKWGLHSPLMYWNCSSKAIENDTDILATVNARASEHSALGLALRPSTVFAGKAFANKKLQAADALVITLFDKAFDTPGSNLGYTWEKRSRKLVAELGSEWDIYPADGQIFERRLFEFRFQPMTLNDDLLLACSYIVTALYVLWKMSQLRAVKSKAGLLITICAKMTICVIASFTICAYLGIDLGRIPRPWFPGVFFCFGLGNIFRLINCVLETPPEMPPNVRIGHALGEVGHLSLAVAGQNLVLIYLCSRIVTPWVADFCVFAAVTLVLDFVFHLTFFVAVLSVDVQRMELQDSLERVELIQTSKTGRQERQSWLSALSRGNGPVSTRFAGTMAILSMILAVNWHFFDGDSQNLNPRDLLGKLSKRGAKPAPDSTIFKSPPFNQARTPAEWFRIQDHNTAREMVGFIKPSSHSFVARVYDPLLVVMKGAKGRDTGNKHQSLIEVIRHFAHDHAFPAALIAVLIIAVVTLFMNYLLWSGLPDENTDSEDDEERYFEVRTLPVPQALDVVRLAACPKGHIASTSLDKTTSLWLNDRTTGYFNTLLKTAKMKPKLWPIVASTIDDEGSLLAMASDSGQVGLWSIPLKRFLLLPAIDLHGQMPVLFEFFTQHNSAEQDSVGLVVVTPDGYLTMLDPRTGIHQAKQIGEGNVSAATLYTQPKGATHLVFVSKPGEVYIMPLPTLSLPLTQWTPTPEVVAGLDPGPPPGKNPMKIKNIYGVPALGLVFAIRDQEIEIVEFSSRALIHSVKVGKRMKLGSFRVMHSSRRSCACGASAVRTLVVAYGEQDRDAVVLRTYSLEGPGAGTSAQICLGKSSEHGSTGCTGWAQASETVHRVEPAGAWETTSGLSIIGVRRCESEEGCLNDLEEKPDMGMAGSSRAGKDGSKDQEKGQQQKRPSYHRGPSSHPLLSNTPGTSYDDSDEDEDDADAWQAYTLSHAGDFLIRPLLSSHSTPSDEDFASSQQLFVSEPGPVARLGGKSVAVGIGNTIKIISVGRHATAADARLSMRVNGPGSIRGSGGAVEMSGYAASARGGTSKSGTRKIS